MAESAEGIMERREEEISDHNHEGQRSGGFFGRLFGKSEKPAEQREERVAHISPIRKDGGETVIDAVSPFKASDLPAIKKSQPFERPEMEDGEGELEPFRRRTVAPIGEKKNNEGEESRIGEKGILRGDPFDSSKLPDQAPESFKKQEITPIEERGRGEDKPDTPVDTSEAAELHGANADAHVAEGVSPQKEVAEKEDPIDKEFRDTIVQVINLPEDKARTAIKAAASRVAMRENSEGRYSDLEELERRKQELFTTLHLMYQHIAEAKSVYRGGGKPQEDF